MNRQMPSIILNAQFIGKVSKKQIDTSALLDSGAEGILVNSAFTSQNRFSLKALPHSIPVLNVDGSTSSLGPIHFSTVQNLRLTSVGNCVSHEEQVELLVADLGEHDVILGTDWLHCHNPEIH